MLPSVDFYLRPDPVPLAQELLGMRLCTRIGGVLTVGRIVETEAYRAPEDRASHAYGHRRTARTATMYAAGGRAYIYLCYGIHHLFNVVTGPAGTPHAVLIRAVEPLLGVETMLERRGFLVPKPQLTAGPGVLTKALGLHRDYNGVSLLDPSGPVWLETAPPPDPADIRSGPRIGVDYAGESAAWPWRFWLESNPWVSAPGLPKK